MSYDENRISDQIDGGLLKQQWDQYEIDLKAHKERCGRERPRPEDFNDLNGGEAAYNAAYQEWEKMRFCDAPNKPGYYRANND